MADWERPPWLVRIRPAPGAAPVGGGVLCTDRHVVTCAHVLDGATEVHVDFPFAPPHAPLLARVVRAFPETADRTGDVAVLEVVGELPAGSPAPLRVSTGTTGHRFRAHGFPRGHDGGVIARGVVLGPTDTEWLQVQAESTLGFAIDRGFSGAPLWDEEWGAVVGIVVAREGARDLRTGYVIPVEAIRRYWEPLRPWVGWRLDHDPDLRAHWSPRARGVHRDSLPGQHFTGRRAALARLVDWVTGDEPLHVVTGGPGSGKSSVLARLVVLADPLRRGPAPPVAPPVGAVTVAFRCTGLDLGGACEVLSRFHRPTSDPETLVADLVEQGEPAVVVVDALDEAVTESEARAIAVRLLRPLTETGLVRVLVGTRPGYRGSLLRALGDAPRTDLDSDEFFDPADVVEHAERHLLAGSYRDEPAAARRVAEAIARRSGSSFLVAGLTARAWSRSAAVDLADPRWEQAFPTDVDEAMRQYLARLPDPDRTPALLRPVAHGRHPGLPLDLWEAVARAYTSTATRADVDGLLRAATSYVLEQRTSDGEPVYGLFHQALTDHLRDLDGGGLVERTITEVLIEDTRVRGGWRHAREYARLHAATHAAAAGMLDRLVTDPEFLLVAERHAVLRALGCVRGPEAATFAEVYRSAAHALTGTPDDNAAHLELTARRLGHDGVAERFRTPHQPFVPLVVPRVGRTADLLLTGHPSPVNALVWGLSRGRPVLVGGTEDGTVLCWDPTDGALLDSFDGTAAVTGLCWIERAGATLLVADRDDATVRLWDLDHRPDRSEIVTRRWEGSPAWRADEGLPAGLRGLLGHHVASVWGSLDGHPIVLRTSGGEVRAWRVVDGTPLFTLSAHVWSGPLAWGEVAGRPVLVTSGNDELDEEGGDEPIERPRAWVLVDDRMVGHGSNGLLRLWDPVERVETGRIEVEDAIVTHLAWGRWDGRDVLAGACDDDLVRVWDTEGAVVTSFPGVAPLAWGEVDGRAVLATGTRAGDAQVWDGVTRLFRAPDPVTALAWGEVAGRPVLACAGGRGRIQLWSDFEVGPAAAEDVPTAFAWDPTGRLSVAGFASGRVEVRRPDGVLSFVAHDDGIDRIAWGAALATRAAGGEVRLWDPTTGELVAGLPLRDPQPGVRAVGPPARVPPLFDWVSLAGGEYLLIAASSAEAGLWAADGTHRPLELPDYGHPVRFLGFATGEDRPIVLCGAGGELRLHDLETLAELDLLRQGVRYAVGAESAFAAGPGGDGLVIASGGRDGSLTFWEPGTSLIHPSTWLPAGPVEHAHDGSVNTMTWLEHPDGIRLATGGEDGLVRLWDPGAPERPFTISGAGGAVHALEANADVLVVGTADGTVRVHRVADGGELHVLPGAGSSVGAVAAATTPEGLLVAFGSDDGVVHLWNTWDGELFEEPVGDGAVLALAWGVVDEWPTLAAGFDDGRIGVWSLYDPDAEPVLSDGGGAPATTVAWSTEGPVLYVGYGDGSVGTWDPSGATESRLVPARRRPDGGMAFGVLDGRAVLAAGGGGSTFRLWDLEDRELMVVGDHYGTEGRLLCWGDGRVVAETSWNVVRAFDPVDGTVLHEIAVPGGHAGEPTAAFGRVGDRAVLAVATRGGSIMVVDVEHGARRTFEWHEPVLGLAFGADDRLAVLDARGGTVIRLTTG